MTTRLEKCRVVQAVVRYLRDSAKLCKEQDDIVNGAALEYAATLIDEERMVIVDDYANILTITKPPKSKE